jgi:hypothetical protein
LDFYLTELYYLQESGSRVIDWEDKLIVLNLPWASSGVASGFFDHWRTGEPITAVFADSLPNYSRNSFRDLKKSPLFKQCHLDICYNSVQGRDQ